MEKDLNNLINVIKGLHDRLESKAWKGKITINPTDNIEALFDLGDYGNTEIGHYYIPSLTFTEVKTNRTFCYYLENSAHLFPRDNLELEKVSVKDFYKDYRLGVLFHLSDGFSEFLVSTRAIIKSAIFTANRATEIVEALNKTNEINVSVDLTAMPRRAFNVLFNSKAKKIAKHYNTELTLDLKGLKWGDVDCDYFHIGTIYLNKITDTISQLEKEQSC